MMDVSLLVRHQDEEDTSVTSTASAFLPRATSSPSIIPPIPVAAGISLPLLQSLTANIPATSAFKCPPPAHTTKFSRWSSYEDALVIKLRNSGMKWEDISSKLPGRSSTSCRLHYQNYLERQVEWGEDEKNMFASLYDRFKAEMWSNLAQAMAIPWRTAEAMHWQLGEKELARRAGVVPFSLSNPAISPSAAKSHRASTLLDRPSKRSKSRPVSYAPLRLPSVEELAAGVPVCAPTPPFPSRPAPYRLTPPLKVGGNNSNLFTVLNNNCPCSNSRNQLDQQMYDKYFPEPQLRH